MDVEVAQLKELWSSRLGRLGDDDLAIFLGLHDVSLHPQDLSVRLHIRARLACPGVEGSPGSGLEVWVTPTVGDRQLDRFLAELEILQQTSTGEAHLDSYSRDEFELIIAPRNNARHMGATVRLGPYYYDEDNRYCPNQITIKVEIDSIGEVLRAFQELRRQLPVVPDCLAPSAPQIAVADPGVVLGMPELRDNGWQCKP